MNFLFRSLAVSAVLFGCSSVYAEQIGSVRAADYSGESFHGYSNGFLKVGGYSSSRGGVSTSSGNGVSVSSGNGVSTSSGNGVSASDGNGVGNSSGGGGSGDGGGDAD